MILLKAQDCCENAGVYAELCMRGRQWSRLGCKMQGSDGRRELYMYLHTEEECTTGIYSSITTNETGAKHPSHHGWVGDKIPIKTAYEQTMQMI